MTTTSCERYLEKYKKHLITNVAYEHLAVDDTDYMKRMRAPARTTHRAAVAPTRPTEGSERVHLPAARSQATKQPATTTEKGAATIATSDLKRLCPKCKHVFSGEGPFAATAHPGRGYMKGGVAAVCSVPPDQWVHSSWLRLDRRARFRAEQAGTTMQIWDADPAHRCPCEQCLQVVVGGS